MERERHQNEINELNRIIEKLCADMKKYELVCHFCSVKMDEGTINTGCHRNIPESTSRTYNTGLMKEYYTTSQIPIECVGNKRHFFGQPNRTLTSTNSNSTNKIFSSNAFPQFSQNFSSPKRDLNSSGYTTQRNNKSIILEEPNINAVLDKIKNSISNKQTNILEMFRLAFRESDIVSSDNLKAFLKKTFGLEENEITKFLSYFKCNALFSGSVSSSLNNSISYQMTEIFAFLKSKHLHSNYNDSKINKFETAGVVFAGISALK
jgi:hypothetical protein